MTSPGRRPGARSRSSTACWSRHFPSVGAQIGRAVAQASAGDVTAGLALLDSLPADTVRAHQPYWVALAHVRRLADEPLQADRALDRAIGLTSNPRVREHLLQSATKPPG